jgi:hypothetical protein
LCRIHPFAAHHQSGNQNNVAGDMSREDIPESQKARQVNHARDDAEQSGQPLLQPRQCQLVIRWEERGMRWPGICGGDRHILSSVTTSLASLFR